MRRITVLVLVLSLSAVGLAEGAADERRASLKGSRASMKKQNGVAKENGLSFFTTAGEIREAVDRGDLVELGGNDDYEVADFVSHPYTIPAVRTFVERLSSQYRQACGQKLVVTSATRASTRQPSNASKLSVHPAGMAVDVRVSDDASCREWLESSVLSMEKHGVIDGIREYNPPHYHIAIYPEAYLAYAEDLDAAAREKEAREAAEAEAAAARGGETAAPAAEAPVQGTDEAQSGQGALLALVLTVVALTTASAVTRRWWLPHALPHAQRFINELRSLRLNRG